MRKTYERDRGICARCACDTIAWRRAFLSVLEVALFLEHAAAEAGLRVELARGVRARARDLGFDPWAARWWQRDHVLARGLGGDDTLENSQTLCGTPSTRCHGQKTREDLAVMARRRKRARPWRTGRWPSRPMRS